MCKQTAQSLCTPTMTTFNFKSIQLLELADSDQPTIDVQDGQLILTAERDGESIRITAPLNRVLPQAKATTVTMPHRRAASPLRGKSLPGGDKRVGEMNGMAKLTEATVREIRLLLSDKKFVSSFQSTHAMHEELAKAYKVHFATIRSVARNESWKHVKI